MIKVDPKYGLYFKAPASGPADALLQGNGAMTVLSAGGTDTETFWIHHAEFWSGYPEVPESESDFRLFYTEAAKSRRLGLGKRLLKETRVSSAFEKQLREHFPAASPESFLPLGKLVIRQQQGKGSELPFYERALDLRTGLQTCQFTFAGGEGAAEYPLREYRRECFVSAADDLFALRWESLDGAPMNVAFSFESPLRLELMEQSFADYGSLGIFMAQAPNHLPPLAVEKLTERGISRLPNRHGMRCCLGFELRAEGDKVTFAGGKNGLALSGATAFTLTLCMKCDDGSGQAEADLRNRVAALKKYNYKDFLERHTEDFRKRFGSFDLTLEAGAFEEPFTPEQESVARLQRFRHMPVFRDADFYALLVRYGQYLAASGLPLATCLRPSSSFTEEGFQTVKGSFYHLYDDFAEAYRVLGGWGMAPQARNLFRALPVFEAKGLKTAETVYGSGGLAIHCCSDRWGYSDPAAVNADGTLLSAWPLGGAVLTELWSFLLDFLPPEEAGAEALPLFRFAQESARFILSMLKKTSRDELYFGPVCLPEEGTEGGLHVWTTEAQVMTEAHLGRYLDLAQRFLKRGEFPAFFDEDLYQEAQSARAALLKPALPEAFAEAAGEEAAEEGHYLSLLKALWLGNSERFGFSREALKKALNSFCDRDDRTLIRRACLWALLQDGDRALRLLRKTITALPGAHAGLADNLSLRAGAFEPEGNILLAGAICMLFVQETEGTLRLLPALPLDIASGEIKGFRTASGITVDFSFKDRELESARFTNTSAERKTLDAQYRKKIVRLELAEKEQRVLGKEDFS